MRESREAERVKVALSSAFEMTNFGEVITILGMRVTRHRNNGILNIDKEKYARKVIENFGMEICNPTFLPMPTKQYLSKTQGANTEL